MVRSTVPEIPGITRMYRRHVLYLAKFYCSLDTWLMYTVLLTHAKLTQHGAQTHYQIITVYLSYYVKSKNCEQTVQGLLHNTLLLSVGLLPISQPYLLGLWMERDMSTSHSSSSPSSIANSMAYRDEIRGGTTLQYSCTKSEHEGWREWSPRRHQGPQIRS